MRVRYAKLEINQLRPESIMLHTVRLLSTATVALALAGCATTPQPLPFDLVGKGSTIHRGLFRPADGSVDVRINNKVYTGFYVTSVSTARSTNIGFGMGYGGYGRYGYGMYGAYPSETWTTVSNNTGKAYLQSADGDKLNCDFMYEGRRLLGECRSPDTGAVYQMVANQAVTNPPPADASSPAPAAAAPAPPPAPAK
jgi:hypothetical protein